MKRLMDKVRRLRVTRWANLTLGEKIIKLIFTLLKIAVIGAIVITVVGAVAAFVGGMFVAVLLAKAIGDGFYNASKTYSPGQVYVNDNDLR